MKYCNLLYYILFAAAISRAPSPIIITHTSLV